MSDPATYTAAEVDALTERAGELMDQLREVFREISEVVTEITAERGGPHGAGADQK